MEPYGKIPCLCTEVPHQKSIWQGIVSARLRGLLHRRKIFLKTVQIKKKYTAVVKVLRPVAAGSGI
jgi:hypothetical protein